VGLRAPGVEARRRRARAGRAEPLEREIERAAVAAAAAAGIVAVKLTGARPSAGWPDRVFVVPPDGRHVWIEFKQPSGRVTPLQERRIAQLRAAGADVHVCRSVDEAIAAWGEVAPL